MFLTILSQIPGLSGGVRRFCKKSSVYSQLTHVTDRQTDIRPQQWSVYCVTLAKNTLWLVV